MADIGGDLRNVVLVVDDESEIRRMATAALSRAGFKAQVAQNGAEGVECFLRHRHELCLVVADVVMPVMSGLEMLDHILEIEPETKILIMSGYSSPELEITARDRFAFIRKPFLQQDFIAKVKEVLERPAGTTG
jgi:two-component system, cell cycle sensor histidine kinase and response regulator CckA